MNEVEMTEQFFNRFFELGIVGMAIVVLFVFGIALIGAIYIVIRVTKSSDKMATSLEKKVDADAVQTNELKTMAQSIQAMQNDNAKKIEVLHSTLTATKDTRAAIDTLDTALKASMESMRQHVSSESAATADKVIAEIKPLLDHLNEIKTEAAAATKQHIEAQNAIMQRVDHAQDAIITELLRLLQTPQPAATPPPVAIVIAPPEPAKPPETPADAPATTDTPAAA